MLIWWGMLVKSVMVLISHSVVHYCVHKTSSQREGFLCLPSWGDPSLQHVGVSLWWLLPSWSTGSGVQAQQLWPMGFKKTGEDNHFSLLMWIIFSLSQMLSQIGLRTSVLAQPETGGSGLGPEAAPSSLRSATETWCIWPWASRFPSLGLSCLICKMRELD